MGYLIDSGIFIAMERGTLASEAFIERAGDAPCFVSAVTESELWHGVHRASTPERAAKRAFFVEKCLREAPSLPADHLVARKHALIWAEREALGQIIGSHDLWIAATALVHDFTLATRNEREFRRVPGLRVEVW